MRRFFWMARDACLLLAVIVAACFVGSARADHIGDKDNYSQYLLLSPYGKCVDDAQIFADGMLIRNTGGPRRLSGCHDNVEGLLADCTELPNHSEAQIGARYRCTADAWQKYFACAQLYPRATLSEQIEREL